MRLKELAMGLNKLGKYIELIDKRNSNNQYGLDCVVGLSTQKQIIRTKADLDGVNLSSYKLFEPETFAYVPDTSRRGDKISLAFNNQNETFLVSSISCLFKVKENSPLLSEFLFMYFNRPEFDRYTRFHSWGSARETFDWETMCDINIELPSLVIQQKYVNIYQALLKNQQSYEQGLEDLKLLCDGYIEDLRKKHKSQKIGNYITECNNKVEEQINNYSVQDIVGISSIDKNFMKTKADVVGLSVKGYKIVKPNEIAFNPNTARMGERIPIAFNNSLNNFLVSAIYPVFLTDKNYLLAEYLMMWFKRSEFDRYARFHSWGSARETFTWEDMCEVKIPIPDIKIQQSIVDIYKCYVIRKEINEKLKIQLKNICPILIKGALEEANNE